MRSFEGTPIDAHKDEVALEPECLIPLLILETLAKSDRPMSVADTGKSLDIETTKLQQHFGALEEQEFIQSSGSQTDIVFGRSLVMHCAALEAGDLTWGADPQADGM